MPETRRELFRTSVVTALGGLAAGTLAGCNTLRGELAVDMPAGSVAVVRGTNNDGTVHLYFFSFGADNSACSVYSLPASPSPPITNVFDTAALFNAILPALTQIKTPIQTTFVLNNNMSYPFYIDVDHTNYFLKATSLGNLINVAQIYISQIAGSWNEIGKQ